uniref:Tim44-like domain-containing protein n=1 Tax=Ananas comosus var. bracteatus TaxID=296719 RepID=A0A6V7Q7H4_ANACO|nr:unnamed protein product [Ananas comosus var. bracteatus]
MVSTAFQKLKEAKVSTLAKKGYDIVKDELSSDKTNKRHMQYASASTASGETSTRTDIVVVPTKRSRLGEKWDHLKRSCDAHTVFKLQLAEDVRERWETSDNPVVHKIQDLNETVFGEPQLLYLSRRSAVGPVSQNSFVIIPGNDQACLTSYVKADIETLKKYCTREVIERCKGERTAYQAQGIFYDNKILHISEVDVRETKMMGSSPIIILSFQTQQIYCVRDREGNITDGGQDTIQNVYYLWAMQLIDPEELGEGAYYPVWRLREMQQQGIQALI